MLTNENTAYNKALNINNIVNFSMRKAIYVGMWIFLLLEISFSFIQISFAKERVYYIAAKDVEWDYAPSGDNMIDGDMSIAGKYLYRDKDRIGRIYTKTIYKQFTDWTFSREIPAEPWRGRVGPVMRAEVGDTLIVHFKNKACRPYNIHPHSKVFHDKSSEGALYDDNTYGRDKRDDIVLPGHEWTYRWEVKESYGPPKGDPRPCTPVLYHSHVQPDRDIDTGLVGVFIVCRKGTLTPDGFRKDVNKEYVIYMDGTKEHNSWLTERNIHKCGDPKLCRHLLETENKEFIDSTVLQHINGFVFGNTPDFNVCQNEKVVFYAFGMNEGFNTVYIHSHILEFQGTRNTEEAWFHAGQAREIYMENHIEGRWLLSDRQFFKFKNGMTAFLNVSSCPKFPKKETPRSGKTTKYYLAVEDVVSSYTPNGIVATVGRQTEQIRRKIEECYTVGPVKHASFIEYTDASFKTRKTRKQNEIHLADTGPTIDVQKGDILEITLQNRVHFPVSFFPTGVAMSKENEGALYRDSADSKKVSGKIAMPGETITYQFTLPVAYEPDALRNVTCFVGYYISNVDYERDVNSRLFGILRTCTTEGLDKQGNQVDVDKSYFLVAIDIDETKSWYYEENKRNNAFKVSCDRNDECSESKNDNSQLTLFPTFNGRQYGNLEGINVCVGDRISFSVVAFSGAQSKYQTYIFEGHNVIYVNRNNDFVTVPSGYGTIPHIVAKQPGQWYIKSGQLDQQERGMLLVYNVSDCSHKPKLPPRSITPVEVVRRYYIAAVAVEWDFARKKVQPVTLENLENPKTDGHIFVRDDAKFIGTKYYKAVYREFTDSSFTKILVPEQADEHLGLLGPKLKANVGDAIKILYKNLVNFPNSLWIRGVNLDFQTKRRLQAGILPGEVIKLTWHITEDAAPTKTDPNCTVYAYESLTNPMTDMYSGLIGPAIICRKGVLDSHGNRRDGIDREFVLFPFRADESKSYFYKDNAMMYAPARKNICDAHFRKANTKYSINGFMYFNLPGLEMFVGDKVAWYVMTSGSKGDLQTITFYGQGVIEIFRSKTRRESTAGLEAGQYFTLEMFCESPGRWMLRSHNGEDMWNGAMAYYDVLSGSDENSEKMTYNVQDRYSL